jgi:HEPN domain-containing protein
LVESGKYVWSLFIGHLALEKLLKAFWVRDNEPNFPPSTHDLNRIIKETNLFFSDEEKEFLAEVTAFNLEVRYPDFKRRFNEKCTKDFANKYLKEITELFECILKKM